MDEVKDVVAEEKSEAPVETASPAESSPEKSADAEAEKMIPYSRFKEVNTKMHDLENRISDLSKKGEEKPLSDEQKKELDAKTYLKNLLKETQAEEERAKKETEDKELKEFNAEVSDELELHPEVKRDDFTNFLEKEAEQYGVTAVDGAMKLFLKLNTSVKEAKDTAKREILSRPKFSGSEGTPAPSAGSVHGKSMSQLAAEAQNELEKSR